MSKIVKALAILTLIACAAIGSNTGPQVAQAGTTAHRAVWVCFYEFAAAGLSNRTEAAFRKNAEAMYDDIKAYGCNEVYFHVRSYDDAIYPSKIVGWSSYMCSDKRSPGYDPLKILVELAHKKNLKFHAWMNPYRVTTSKILDPSKKKTINRVVNQVEEIVKNYDVDGIHFDDYFYLGDKYAKVKAKTRRKNVNKLIKKVYSTVKGIKKSVQFGISPAGNFEYSMSIGGDVKTWMSKKGYIDYIVPQIYWSDAYKLSGKMHKLYTERLAYWRSMNKIDLPMYIGLGVYRAGLSSGEAGLDTGWAKKKTNLASQLQQIKEGNTEGYSLFAYTDMLSKRAAKEMKNFLRELSWIKLNETEVNLKKGETFTLKAKWKPDKVIEGPKISFRSLDENIATVTKKGVITAVAESGEVKIQAYSDNKVKTCVVTIGEKKETENEEESK
ncbi:MAG: family 10 glycosylhydrolase [Eubacterium sp.]|nr:family 10 glycosylhydrolase [Eubacterium sp.]